MLGRRCPEKIKKKDLWQQFGKEPIEFEVMEIDWPPIH